MFDRDFWSRWPHHGMYFDTAGGHGGTAGAIFFVSRCRDIDGNFKPVAESLIAVGHGRRCPYRTVVQLPD